MISQGQSSPEFEPWNIAAVRLLQGVVYDDDKDVWKHVLAWQSRLEEYFSPLGLRLVLDETDGFAFLRARDDDEFREGFEKLPRLFRRSRLSYDATLLCVLLREELLRFEAEDFENGRCVCGMNELFEQWKAFFPGDYDEVRLRRGLTTALRTLEDLRFVKRFQSEADNKSNDQWEVRRVLKARLTAADLENIKQQLTDALARRNTK